jgi:hypothetical protein
MIIMSVLIKGMYMPRMCAECAFMGGLICPDNVYTCDCPVADDVCGVNITQAVDEDCRHPDCPLVEVTEKHGDLIDREKLLCDIEKHHLSDGKFQHWVEVQLTVIEQEDE